MVPGPILVVEDDDDIRRYAVTVLEEAGYDVLTARDAIEAFRLLEQNPTIRLMFTDIVMPRIDGLMLADMAKLRRPGIKVLYATAFVDDARCQPGYRYGEVLGKPYRSAELLAAVVRTLDKPSIPQRPAA
jgi:CheY-like chemotaxis protein